MNIAKDREASGTWTFSFAPQLAFGETLTSATVTVLSGTTDVSATVVGTVAVAAAQGVASAGVTFGLVNTATNSTQTPGIYDLEIAAVTSTGRRLIEDGQLVVTGDAVLHTPRTLVAQETVTGLVVGHVRNGAYTPKDPNGNTTADVVTYTSNAPTVATVDANTGQITPVATGTVTITASCNGATQARTLTCYNPIVPTLAWEPLQGQKWPRVFVADTNNTNGNSWSTPQWGASGYWGNRNSRTVPYSPDKWVTGLPQGDVIFGAFDGNNGTNGSVTIAATTNPVPGYSATPVNHTTLITFGAAPAAVWYTANRYWHAGDGDAYAPQRRWGQGWWFRASTAADVGKTFDLLSSPVYDVSSTSVTSRKTFTLTAAWQYCAIDGVFQGEDISTNHVAIATGSTGTPALALEALWVLNMGPTSNDNLNPAAGGWCSQWGMPAEMSNDNAWGPDSDFPPLYGSTIAKVSTSEFAPDADCYYDNAPFTHYWMPNGAGVQAPGLVNLSDLNSDTGGVGHPGVGAKALYVGVYVKPNEGGALPNDGDLQATLLCGATTYGPTNLVRDPAQLRRSTDGASFYRCRIPINLSSENYTSGTLRVLNATSGVLHVVATRWYAVPEAGRTTGWHHCLTPSRNVRVQAPSAAPTLTPSGTGGTLAAGTYRYVVTAIDNANNPMAESLASAEASVTVSGTTSSVALAWPAVTGAAKYRVYRSPAGGAAGSENVYYTTSNSTASFTDTGAANTAGSPPATAPYMLQELAWLRAINVYDLITVDHGMWGLRVMLPYDWQKVYTENRYQVGFWQSGPLGSSDYNFDMSFLNSGQAFPTLDVQMLRNGQVGYDSWECNIPCGDGAAQTIPAFQAVDIVLAWSNRTLLCIGIGFDGTSNITWLTSTSTLFGKPCTIGTRTPGTTWEFTNDGNMLMAWADRDRTRVHGGWQQAFLASKTVPATAAECQAVLQEYVRYYWGNRPRY